jgi:DNA invertase Pin-like site-specific DNA recombinase
MCYTLGMSTKLVAYVRVSTQKQGQSGLGLEAQQTAIGAYARSAGGQVIATYTEVESGKRTDRPELARAIAHAKRAKARLVIAKLDRLGRNVAFISALMESKVDFVACDNPHANKLTLHILSAIAEHEAEMISQRTRAALAAARARGTRLGSHRPGHWKGREEARRAGAVKGGLAAKAKRDAESRPVYEPVKPIIASLRNAGASLQEIADRLNHDGHTTVSGAAWNKVQVRRLLLAA